MWNSSKLLVLAYLCIFSLINDFMAVFFLYFLIILWAFFSIRAIIEISKFPYKRGNRKLIWTNLVIMFPVFGLLLYYMYGKQNLSE